MEKTHSKHGTEGVPTPGGFEHEPNDTVVRPLKMYAVLTAVAQAFERFLVFVASPQLLTPDHWLRKLTKPFRCKSKVFPLIDIAGIRFDSGVEISDSALGPSKPRRKLVFTNQTVGVLSAKLQ